MLTLVIVREEQTDLVDNPGVFPCCSQAVQRLERAQSKTNTAARWGEAFLPGSCLPHVLTATFNLIIFGMLMESHLRSNIWWHEKVTEAAVGLFTQLVASSEDIHTSGLNFPQISPQILHHPTVHAVETGQEKIAFLYLLKWQIFAVIQKRGEEMVPCPSLCRSICMWWLLLGSTDGMSCTPPGWDSCMTCPKEPDCLWYCTPHAQTPLGLSCCVQWWEMKVQHHQVTAAIFLTCFQQIWIIRSESDEESGTDGIQTNPPTFDTSNRLVLCVTDYANNFLFLCSEITAINQPMCKTNPLIQFI